MVNGYGCAYPWWRVTLNYVYGPFNAFYKHKRARFENNQNEAQDRFKHCKFHQFFH